MGRSIIPTYYAKYRDQSGWHDISWKGRATEAKAEKLRKTLNYSFNPGGCNYHVSKAVGYIIHVSEVKVVRNDRSGEVVAMAKAPMFEVM